MEAKASLSFRFADRDLYMLFQGDGIGHGGYFSNTESSARADLYAKLGVSNQSLDEYVESDSASEVDELQMERPGDKRMDSDSDAVNQDIVTDEDGESINDSDSSSRFDEDRRD